MTKDSPTFHPFELAFGGYSNSGKTTLITRLIHRLARRYQVAYVKHDIHRFEMDHPGKDTFEAYAKGAGRVFISDKEHFACVGAGKASEDDHRALLASADIALIEGYKHSAIPKVILLDDQNAICDEIVAGKIHGVVACVGKAPQGPGLEGIPYFQRDDLDGLTAFVEEVFQKQAQTVPLYGLVLAGGKSSRMGRDKSTLNYHGAAQVKYCHDLLRSFCEEVFVSNRPSQADLNEHQGLNQIHDSFLDMGPLGGILSAMRCHPAAAWLVLACDLPWVDQEVIQTLLNARNPFVFATAYQSAHNAWPEPLCTVYEPKMYPRLLAFLGTGHTCPRKALINSRITMIRQPRPNALDNINHPHEYQRVIKEIRP